MTKNTSDTKLKIDLKQILLDQNGKPIKIIDKQSVMITGMNMITITKSGLQSSKKLTFGDSLLDIFARKISVKTFEEAAKMKRWHSSIYNENLTAKGTLSLTSNELKDMKNILDEQAKPDLFDVIIDGQVYEIITDYLQKALTQKL